MLKIKNFEIPGFTAQRFVRKNIEGAVCIEGATLTNNFNEVGVSYYPGTGELTIMSKNNERLYHGKIKTQEDFENKLKYADKKLLKK